MPKIIDNLQTRLLEEARLQVEQVDYGAMTIRSVAAACSVGVGTVYNYYPSKEALVAAFILSDWQACMDRIHRVSGEAEAPKPVLECIAGELTAFAKLHEKVFRDSAAAPSFAGSFSRYHSLLRSQLAQPLERFCSDSFAAEFIAEALLTWTMAGKPFDQIYGQLGKLF